MLIPGQWVKVVSIDTGSVLMVIDVIDSMIPDRPLIGVFGGYDDDGDPIIDVGPGDPEPGVGWPGVRPPGQTDDYTDAHMLPATPEEVTQILTGWAGGL